MLVVASRTDGARLVERLRATDVNWVALSVVALCFGVLVNAHRWAIVTRVIGHPIKLGTSVRGCFESMMFNQVLPTSVGGDAARVVCAAQAGVPSGWAIIGVMIDRALGLCILALCLVPASLIGGSPIIGSPTLRILVAASMVLLAGAAGAAALGGISKDWRAPSWALAPLDLLRAFTRVVASRLAPLLLIDLVVTTALTLASFMLCAAAVNVTMSWLDALIVLQGMTLASILPASIGGWGVREGAAVLLLAPLGIPSSQAVAISVMFGLSITALGLIGCVFWIIGSYRRGRRAPGQKKLFTRR